MSDTPKTDTEIRRLNSCEYNEVDYIDTLAEFARTLERKLQHDETKMIKDRQRLDWLETKCRLEHGNCDRESASHWICYVPTGRDYYKCGVDLPLRLAIDTAINKGRK